MLTLAMPCLVYSLFSMSMVYSNKSILSVYNFHYHFALLFFQNACAVLLVWLAKRTSIVTYPDFDMAIARKWLPVNLFFVGMLLSGTYSVRFLSVPMMTVFKNLTNIPISIGDKYLYGQNVSPGIVFSLFLMVFSALVGGLTDLQFSLRGYIWMFLNCASTAAYVLYLRHAMKNTQLGEFGMMFYNNLLSLPLLSVLCIVFGEFPAVFYEPLLQNRSFLMISFFSGCIGFGLSLSSFWCVRKTSPTTYSLTGSLNKIPLAIFGMFLFDTPVTIPGVSSVIIGLGGGVLYSYTKTTHNKKSLKNEPADREDIEAGVVEKKDLSVANGLSNTRQHGA